MIEMMFLSCVTNKKERDFLRKEFKSETIEVALCAGKHMLYIKNPNGLIDEAKKRGIKTHSLKNSLMNKVKSFGYSSFRGLGYWTKF